MTTLKTMTSEELVARLAHHAIEQDAKLLDNDTAAVNRLYDLMQDIATELKSRPGDQRSALVTLFAHPNIHVRLVAAKKTLAVSPLAARQQLEVIKTSGWLPDCGDAGMCLLALDQGIFKPT